MTPARLADLRRALAYAREHNVTTPGACALLHGWLDEALDEIERLHQTMMREAPASERRAA